MNCDLVIFACEGREHLLKKTYESFRENTDFTFDKVIVSHDGKGGGWACENIKPDVFISSPIRKGYVPSIERALHHVESDFFLWLEDDWTFNRFVNIEFFIQSMINDDNISQTIFLKRPMKENNKIKNVSENLFLTRNGFSANPGVNRAHAIREALSSSPDESTTNLETWLTDWLSDNGYSFAVADPERKEPYVTHQGKLEATGGEWHTVGGGKATLSEPTNNIREVLISPVRLLARSVYLATRTVSDPEARTLERRITNIIKLYAND